MKRLLVLFSLAIQILAAQPGFAQAAIPAGYFGAHLNPLNPQTFPLAVSYGSFRFWDSSSQWYLMSNCNSTNANCQSNPATYTSLSTSPLDGLLANIYNGGVSDGLLFTLSRTPSWASVSPGYGSWAASTPYAKNAYVIISNYVYVAVVGGTSGGTPPSSTTRNAVVTDGTVHWQVFGKNNNCLYGTGECLVPPDLYPDGSGTNAIWDTWITQLATHVNNSTYLTTHAHIKYWEPMNEWWQDQTANNWTSTEETDATYAQMLRMTEDTRCLIAGTGKIHNYPSAGSSTTCASYLSALGQSAIDSSAMIVMSAGDPYAVDRAPSQNFLYCNASPQNDYNGGTTCNYAPTSNLVANCNYTSSCLGSAAVDVINYHMYSTTIQPEGLGHLYSNIQAFLSAADKAKPFFNGEGSWGESGGSIWTDDSSRAGFTVRFNALSWSIGMARNYWYAYNNSQTDGTLYYGSPPALTAAGVAYNTSYAWLEGSTPANSPFCAVSGTVYTCPLTLPSSLAAELVWDSQFGPGGSYGGSYADCSTSPNTTVCGNTSFSVPALYNGGWVDVTGASYAHSSSVTIGAMPILLEAAAAGSIAPPAPTLFIIAIHTP